MITPIVRVRVTATVPTQPYGNIVIEAETHIGLEIGEDADSAIAATLYNLQATIAGQVDEMNCDGAVKWLTATGHGLSDTAIRSEMGK